MKQVEKTSAQALGTSGTSGTPRITPEVAAFDPGRVPVAKRVGSREPGAGRERCLSRRRLGGLWRADLVREGFFNAGNPVFQDR